ncbi:hypothetical protein LQ954_08670 [Sphingomonas sp. IC-11]|uniref:hypothetical protein n=1 Tax=Sphingomonas sp. IC-11 TaxID=2898528 RepID=UPI001E5D316F|nr:hypothetical protein [Sphingomonas sp. IC-11]MCD2316221.1 hypothetical protein [Sphingomonas sp. IC-11]
MEVMLQAGQRTADAAYLRVVYAVFHPPPKQARCAGFSGKVYSQASKVPKVQWKVSS